MIFSIGIGILMCFGGISIITGKNYLAVTKDLKKVVDTYYAIVDNYSAGGIIASVDIDRGIVTAAAEDMCGKRYAFHPTTDAQIIGFKVPYWSDIVALAKEAASIASIPYVGWDIAVREKDCVLVEGNHHPMVNTIQVADGGGKRVLFNQYLKLKQGIDTWPKS